MRLFVAVPIPGAVAERAVEAVPDLPALRRVRPEVLHVTLAFLGAIEDARFADVSASVRDAVGGRPAFDVAIDTLGRFPPSGVPRIVWLGVGAGAAELIALSEAVRRQLGARGVSFDPKPFRPHVTLARVRETADRETVRAVAAAVQRARLPRLGFRADAVVVFESALSPKGPRYTARAVTPLVGGKP